MAALVYNGKTIRNMDNVDLQLWIHENFGGWDIENEWTMSTGCQVIELCKWDKGVCKRETLYWWDFS